MKNIAFTPDITEMELPQSNSVLDCAESLRKLESVDYFAPLHAVMGRHHFVSDENYDALPSPYGKFYHNLGIEMCADDRYPIEDAALYTGFYHRGICMIVCAAVASGGQDHNLMAAVRDIFKYPEVEKKLPKKIVALAKELLSVDPGLTEIEQQEDPQSNEASVAWWVNCLEREMMVDINAHSIITGYYLSAKVGRHCSIFAPLGYAPYKEIGEKMAKDPIVLEAAKKSGLLVSGISTFMEAALSNDGCWEGMVDGVAFLLNAPDLRNYVPFRYRYIAERMLRLNDIIKSGKQTWGEVYEKLAGELSDEWAHGY